MDANPAGRLSLVDLVILSSPMIAVQLIEVAWRVYLPAHFAASTGLSLSMVGGLLLAIRLFDTVLDPAIAWASDRYPSRYGHRRPWMVAGVVPIMLGATGVYFSWPGLGPSGLIAASLLLHAGFMMLVTPHGGWMLEYSPSGRERLRIVAARSWVAGAGMMAVLAVPSLLEHGFHIPRSGQIAALGAALLVLCPATVAITVMRYREPDACRHPSSATNPFRLFTGLLTNHAMRAPLLLYVCSGIGEAGASATLLFFFDDALGLQGWGSLLLLLQSAVGLAALPFWSALADRIGRSRLLLATYGWQAATMVVALILPAGALLPALAFVIGRGLLAGADFVLLRAMVADVAASATRGEERNGATCYAMSNMALKVAMGAGAWMALTIMDVLPPSWPPPLASARMDIRAAVAMPSILAAACAMLVVWRIIPQVRGKNADLAFAPP